MALVGIVMGFEGKHLRTDIALRAEEQTEQTEG